MKKRNLIIVILLTIILLGIGTFMGVKFIVLKHAETKQNSKLNNQTQFSLFNSKDINDKEISNDIFKGHKLNMINIWATTCPSCIEEMPELEKISKEFKEDKEFKKDDVQLIGIVSDGSSDLETAKEFINKQGITFNNIIPDKDLKNYLNDNVIGTPVTLFVDNNGNLVGGSIVGAKSANYYKDAIKEMLTQIK